MIYAVKVNKNQAMQKRMEIWVVFEGFLPAAKARPLAFFDDKWYTYKRKEYYSNRSMDNDTLQTQESIITLLLIDDDPGYVSILKHRLAPFQGKRFEIIWESQSENAIKRLRENKSVDLVLMDYYLPNQTGLDVTRQIYEEKIDVPIIFLTSNKDFRAAVEAMKYGVEDYLLKEDSIDTILPRTILNVLDRVNLKKKIDEVEKRKLLSQKKTEAIQEVVVTICHELNNPLAAIKITTSILSRQQLSDGEKQLLAKLNDNVTSLEQQIRKLRDLNIDQTP